MSNNLDAFWEDVLKSRGGYCVQWRGKRNVLCYTKSHTRLSSGPFPPSSSKSNLVLQYFRRTGKGIYGFMEEPDFKSQREVSMKPSAFCRVEHGTAFSFICTWVCMSKLLMFCSVVDSCRKQIWPHDTFGFSHEHESAQFVTSWFLLLHSPL